MKKKKDDGSAAAAPAAAPQAPKQGSGFRFRWLKFLEKADFKEEERIVLLGKRLIFVFLIVAELLILFQPIGTVVSSHRWGAFVTTLGVEVVLTVSEAIKLFVLKGVRRKIPCYVIDCVAAFVLTAVTGSAYLCTLCVIILTEFYLSSEKILPSVICCAICMVVYVVTFIVSNYFLYQESITVFRAVTQSFNDLVILTVHFLVVNVAVRFYRQYLRLDKALTALDESKAELQEAYDHLAEVTALEERQRIAKDIHDTAGHSITTVIMQTEAAKLILEKNPEEAKHNIVAANLQAKHALEELRESVHLLSGIAGKETLKSALQGIINESSDGTGIKIRSDIDDVTVSDAKYRFLCNTLKEGISNGLRHGNATAFWVELKGDGKKIRFLLSDNGEGADMNRLQKGFGMTSMAAHAERLGGEVEFISEPGEGMELRLTLPADGPRERTDK